MNAKRRPRQLRLAEGADDPPHYHGHRERLRQRLIAAGADSLPDYELLEVILFASNARADVKPLAKDLLERFGGFAELLSAEPDAPPAPASASPALPRSKRCARLHCVLCARHCTSGRLSTRGTS
jgi:hypothetical protein